MAYKKILKRIEMYKGDLVEAFVEYYGEEYRSWIQNKFDTVKYFFETNPLFAKHNLDKYPSKYTIVEKLKINQDYLIYTKIEDSIRKALEEKLVDEIHKKVKTVIPNKAIIKKNLYLLSSFNFTPSYVDAFSSESLKIIEDEKQSKSLKEKLRKDQEKFLKEFGIDKDFVSVEKVDKFIEIRQRIKERFFVETALRSSCGKKLKRIAEEDSGEEYDDKRVASVFYDKNLCAWSWSVKEDDGSMRSGCILKLPFFEMRLDSQKMADLSFIHELVHCVETVEDVGILDSDENNRIANEIRTQMIAIKIAKKLKEKGITIFIDSQENPLRHERCLYEHMFPLVDGIFDKYERFITKCSIEGTPKLLEKRFGKKEWKLFSKKLDDIYEEFGRWDTVYCDDIEDGELIKNLKEKMEINFQKKENNLKNRPI